MIESPKSREMTVTSSSGTSIGSAEEEILLINGRPFIVERTKTAPNDTTRLIQEADPSKNEDDPHLSSNSGTFAGSVVTIMTCAIGSGVIALPYAFSGSGLFPSLGLMIFMSLMTLYSLHLLIKSATWSHAPTYQRVAHIAFGKWGTALVQLLIAVGLYGSMIGFILIIGEICQGMACAFKGEDTNECLDHLEWYLSKHFLSFLFVISIITPLSFFPKIHQFQISSFLAVITVVVVMAVIIFRSVQSMVEDTYYKPIVYSRWSFWGITRALPIMAFSLGCHVQVIPIYYALKSRAALGASSLPLTNWRRMDAVVATSNFLTTMTYLLVGEFGLIDFGRTVHSNILDSYPYKDHVITATRICMAVHVSLAFPLLVWPFRTVVDGWLQAFPVRSVRHGAVKFRVLVFIAQTVGVIALAYGGAVLVPDIGVVFEYIGSVVSTLLNFVLPAAFYLRLAQMTEASVKVQWYKKFPALALAAVGIAIGITGTASTTYRLITHDGDNEHTTSSEQ